MVWPAAKCTTIAQSLSRARWGLRIPARNGWSATRVNIGSDSVFILRERFGAFRYFWLTKFMFLFPDDDDGAGSGAHHAFRSAADAEMFLTRVSVGRDHNQVDVRFL